MQFWAGPAMQQLLSFISVPHPSVLFTLKLTLLPFLLLSRIYHAS